jgi:hypothetical protein
MVLDPPVDQLVRLSQRAAAPDNPNYRNRLSCAQTLIEWRETVAPEDQFWNED